MYPIVQVLRKVLPLVVLVGAASLCKAQYSAAVQGTITDPRGAVVPNVNVTLHSRSTGVDVKQISNASGFYRFDAVAPGDYTVIAEAPGFKRELLAVSVTPSERRGANITLQVGAASVNVTVTTVAPALNPEETRIQTTLASSEVTKLPLAGKDVQQLLALTPGVVGFEPTNPAGGYASTLFAANWTPPFHGNGQGTNSNLYLLDDLPVNDDINQGGAIMMPNADMIDQVTMQTQTYSVENGSAASIETAFTTKSGGNKFHGDLDYTYAGSHIGAAYQVLNTVTAASGGAPAYGSPYKTPLGDFHQNELLGSIGGPIFKDKTFFFFSFQKQNDGIGAPSANASDDWDPAFVQWGEQTFPNSGVAKGMTLAPNSADVEGPNYTVYTVADLLGSKACSGPNFTYTSTLPTFTNGAVTGPNFGQVQGGETYSIPCSLPMYDHGLQFNQSQPFDGLQLAGRLDQVFRGGSDRIYAFYERIHQTLGDLTERPALGATTPSTNDDASLNWVHVFTPHLLNEIHGGYIRVHEGLILTDPAIAGSIPYSELGLDTTDHYQFFFLFGQQAFGPDNELEHTYNLRDTLNYTWRNHVIRGGYQFSREDYLENEQVYARTGFGFNFYNAFQLMADEANYTSYLWSISGVTGQYSPQIYGATSIFNSGWVDDNWRVRPNLTITAGLRYDDFGNPRRYSSSSPFAPVYPGAGSTFQEQVWDSSVRISSNALSQSQNNQWQPRVGFAYSPLKSQQISIHGGIGLYENALTPAEIANNLPTQPPSRISLTLDTPLDFGDFTTTTAPWGHTYDQQLPFPVYGLDPHGNVYSNAAQTSVYSVNLNAFSPTIKPEKFLLYSLGVEKQLPYNMVAGISWTGSHGYDIIMGSAATGANSVSNSDWNLTPSTTGTLSKVRPSSEWADIQLAINTNNTSNFNAMVLTLTQRYKGLSYQANYNLERSLQWSPTFTDSTAGSIAFWPGIYQSHTYYGPTDLDVAQSFSLGGDYAVPKLSAKNLVVNELISGWRISGIAVAQTGTAFSVGNTKGPSYAFDDSWAIDGSSGGTPAFPTYQTGLPRKGFSPTAVSTKGVFTAADFTDPVGAGSRPVLSQQGANTFRNPGYFNVNAEVAKQIMLPAILGEASTLTLRCDLINAFNHTNWGPITNDIGSGTNFGFSTSAYNKRYLQLGARFEF
ncbi:MAG: carboxypeptidase regulatory-like domain-containing protein [Acidobacteriota bacterium]